MEAMHTVIGQQGNRFQLGRELGRGGFGVVHLAAGDDGHSYAIKLIGPVKTPEVQTTFEREIQIAGTIKHEHLLNVIDFGFVEEAEELFLFTVSEYCADGDYRVRLRRSAPLSLDQIQQDFSQILSGLQALHSQLIHRDLKLENILISGHILKIGDFGLSKLVDEATKTLTFKGSGSPAYMAPEVWDLQHATVATDLYAIGVMLFEACTNRLPFEAVDILQLRDMHRFRAAPRAKSINPTVPDHLDGVIKKLLEKDRSQRYQSAEELKDALIKANLVTPNSGGVAADIAARLRRNYDAREVARLDTERRRDEQRDELQRIQYMEEQLLSKFNEAITEINAHLAEVQIQSTRIGRDHGYAVADRTLVIKFFRPNELYLEPLVAERMQTLREHYVVHGGYIEIGDGSGEREGWNIVLVKTPEETYGTWILVETEVSPLTGRVTRYSPIATEAQLLADNLACHWMKAMHIYQLKDKPLETSEILKIIQTFIPG